MTKIIKMIVLMNNKILLSEIEEVGAEVGEPDCKLINPVVLTTTEDKITGLVSLQSGSPTSAPTSSISLTKTLLFINTIILI